MNGEFQKVSFLELIIIKNDYYAIQSNFENKDIWNEIKDQQRIINES